METTEKKLTPQQRAAQGLDGLLADIAPMETLAEALEWEETTTDEIMQLVHDCGLACDPDPDSEDDEREEFRNCEAHLAAKEWGQLAEILEAFDLDECERFLERANERRADYERESPLCVETSIVKTIVFSTGGPHSEIRLESDGEGWTGGEMVFKDWGEYGSVSVGLRDVEAIADFYGVSPEADY